MSSTSISFVKGAAILAVTGVAARIIGAFFRIVLAALLGDEGIGLFMYAYPVYSTLLVISTAGIPVALSKIMAERLTLNDYREALRTFRIAFLILTLTGFIITLLLFFGAEFFAGMVVRDLEAVYPLMAISPAIFFVTIMAALRGFFQGQQNMIPTAASQIVEQLVRVGFSIAMIFLLLPVSLHHAAAGAASGAAAGGLGGFLLLGGYYWRKRGLLLEQAESQKDHLPAPVGAIIARIMRLAVPVTIGGLVIPLISLIDLAVVPRQLQAAGFDLETGRALYGQLTGMAGPVVYFPNVVALALSISLVPAISEAYILANKQLISARSAMAVKLTVLFSFPAAAGLYLLAEPVTILLFDNAEAGYSLAYMSWSVIPLCLYVSTTGIIQGLGRPILPALNMFYGGLVKIVLSWFLTAVPALNVGGAALATGIGLGVAAAFNLYHVHRFAEWQPKWRELVVLPGLGILAMSILVLAAYHVIIRGAESMLSPGQLNGVATLGAIVVGIIFYGLFMMLSGGINREELQMVPFAGAWLIKLAERFRLLRRS
ncbi:MAG: polysaccharide biosynthesis protein [Bacillota bacterium]